jgi:hypothetical protein
MMRLGGAIINIILKKPPTSVPMATLHSLVWALYEKGKYGVDRNYYRISPSVSLNHRKGKLNTYGSISFLHRNLFDTWNLTG